MADYNNIEIDCREWSKEEQGAADDKQKADTWKDDIGTCPFYDVPSKNLQIAHVLLHNLGARMLTGLKNQTTSAERETVFMLVKIIEREQEWRDSLSHEHGGDIQPNPAKDER